METSAFSCHPVSIVAKICGIILNNPNLRSVKLFFYFARMLQDQMTDHLLHFWHDFDQSMQFLSSDGLVSALFLGIFHTAYFVIGFLSFPAAACFIVGC